MCFVSHLKTYKKIYLVLLSILVIIGLGIYLSWDYIQFKRYCKDKELCACAVNKLTPKEKKTFITVTKHMEKTGKTQVDATILKYVSADDLNEMGIKMKACSAEVMRQAMLDSNASNREKFPGDYNCMRHVLINELSNEEILFLQSPESKSEEALKIPEIREIYLITSAKLMKCMDEEIQKQYMEEIKGTKPHPSEKK